MKSLWNKFPTERRFYVEAIVLVLAALVSVFVARQIISLFNSHSPPRPRLLMAKRHISAKARLNLEDLVLAEETPRAPVPHDAYTDQHLHLIQGALVVAPLEEGHFITPAHLWLEASGTPRELSRLTGASGLAEHIPKGFRAYVFHTDSTLFAKPHDYIDLLVTPFQSRSLPYLIVEKGEVVHVRRLDSGKTEWTILVPRQQVVALEQSRRKGCFTPVLQGAHDSSAPHGVRRTHALKRVEIIQDQAMR